MAISVTSIGTGSIENILSALEDIGFTVDTSSNVARWGNDTNAKLYFKLSTSSSNTLLQLYDSSNTLIGTGLTIVAATQMKLVYEVIGNSVVFGLISNASQGNMIQFAIVQPKETGDVWKYIQCHVGSNTTQISRIFDADTEQAVAYGQTSLFNGSANGIQIAKFYDGIRFTDNVFITSVCASVSNAVNANATATANNYVEATIGDDNYLVINFTNNANYNKIAIKRPAA